jgi:hypothetical protein
MLRCHLVPVTNSLQELNPLPTGASQSHALEQTPVAIELGGRRVDCCGGAALLRLWKFNDNHVWGRTLVPVGQVPGS